MESVAILTHYTAESPILRSNKNGLLSIRNQSILTKFRRQEGAVIVELAIVLPLLLLIAFGIIEFGVLLYNKQVVTNASREVARAAINPVPLLTGSQAVDAADPYNPILIRFGPYYELSVTPPADNRIYPQDVTITVTWDHYFLVPLFGFGTNVTLSSQTVVRMM
jgi:hypothetical protein